MQNIEEYIQLPLEQRQVHLSLDEPCSEIGGDSREFRGLLAYFVGSTIPSGMRKIHLCHACNNGKCSNVRHLYWGTASENVVDMVNAKRYVGTTGMKFEGRKCSAKFTRPNALIPDEKMQEIFAVLDAIPKERGWIQRAAEQLNVSHTQIRRYVKRRL